MVSIEAFSELLQVLYSAPLQQEQWQRFLTLVSEHTQVTTGFFISADTRSGLAVLAQGGTWQDQAFVDAYNRKYSKTDPFRAAVIHRSRTTNPAGVYAEQELVPERELLQHTLYRELLRPMDLRYAAISILALSTRRFDAVSLWGTEARGPMDPDSRRLLELLVPHVQTALEVRRALGVTEQRLACAEAMANASATATFVLTRHGRVQHCNSAAASLIGSSESLAVNNGRLAALDTKSNALLSKLFIDAASLPSSLIEPQPSHFLSLDRQSGKRPFQLIATPLPEPHRQRSKADLLLLVTDPDKPSNFPDDALHALYDLTPAETEVANGLLMGYSPEEIACIRRVSAGTVRQQVKSMLNKTGTSRQGHMVRLFMTLPQIPPRMS
jgi:DNA-binding CsgD family transcriptional regulator